MSKNSQLEEKILQTAEELFMENGFDATSTTDIAKRVGCNQALIHYYFRTKENLFQQIFTKKFQLLLQFIRTEKEKKMDFWHALTQLIDNYFDMLSHHRKLPFFLMTELVMNEERRQAMRMKISTNMEYLNYYAAWDRLVKEEVEKGNIRPIETMDLTLDVMSLVVFTFLSLPLYSDMFLQNQEEINGYLERRKQEIKTLIFSGLKK
jgi:AcrR family transcriptional regulator